MCLVWQQLRQNVIKENIQLSAQQIINNYNDSKFLKKDISENDCYA
jgi:hypothetical protein